MERVEFERRGPQAEVYATVSGMPCHAAVADYEHALQTYDDVRKLEDIVIQAMAEGLRQTYHWRSLRASFDETGD